MLESETKRNIQTIEGLMAAGLTAKEARVVRDSVPRRGTQAWEYREMLRRRIECGCLSFGDPKPAMLDIGGIA